MPSKLSTSKAVKKSILHPGEMPPKQGTPVKDRLKAKLAAKQERDTEFLKEACMAIKKVIVKEAFKFPDDYKFRPGEYEFYASQIACKISDAHPDIEDELPKGVF